MSLQLWHSESQSKSSTLITRDAIAAVYSEALDLDLSSLTPQTWRKHFQQYFYELTRAEFSSPEKMKLIASAGLAQLHKHVVDDAGNNVADIVKAGWDSPEDAVITYAIKGTAAPQPVSIPRSLTDQWVNQGLAEPAVAEIETDSMMAPDNQILFALGAGAECAPTKPWIRAGGQLAGVMRPGEKRWAELISLARASAGTLYVPVLASKLSDVHHTLTDSDLAQFAGLDLTVNTAEISNWLKAVSTRCEKVIVGAFSYSPGASHIVVQAVQDALMAQAVERLSRDRLVLTWLGTPTDSIAVNLSTHEDRLERYLHRPVPVRIRDGMWKLWGGLKQPATDLLVTELGTSLALIDCSVAVQGANYLFSKRSQRWRAFLSDAQGVHVAYVVTPPARTSSVLSHRILRASYRGAHHFGFSPFDVPITQTLAAALLIDQVKHQNHSDPLDPAQLNVSRAIHGGLWRSMYEPSTVWLPATMRGWLGIFSSEKSAKL
ncbi:MAG: hypothetical protein RIS75_1129 [Actinomycetota bacterium]